MFRVVLSLLIPVAFANLRFEDPNEICKPIYAYRWIEATQYRIKTYHNKKSYIIARTSIDGKFLLAGHKDDGFLGLDCYPNKQIHTENYEYLDLPEIEWVRFNKIIKKIPDDAIPAGYEGDGKVTFIGRCEKNNQFGKVYINGKILYMSNELDGPEETCDEFQILTLRLNY